MANPNQALPNFHLGNNAQLPPLPQPLQPLNQRLRDQAGAQLWPQDPPWSPPGRDRTSVAPLVIPHGWRRRAPNWCIPPMLAAHQPRPTGNTTDQRHINAFLRALGGITDAGIGGVQGPVVAPYEVSSRDNQHRSNTFEAVLAPARAGQPGVGAAAPWISGSNPNDPTALLLREYSMTAVEAAANCMRLTRGTLFLIANPAPPAELAVSSVVRVANDWANRGLPIAQQNLLGNWVNTQTQAIRADHIPTPWHNVGVFIQSRTDWPEHNQARANGGMPQHLQYTFGGTWRRLYVYDPSYVNESIPPLGGAGRVTTENHIRNRSHLRDHLFHSNTRALLRTQLGDAQTGRAKWVRTDPSVAYIGGGGNLCPLSECRTMAITWMEQVAWLSQTLNVAVDAFKRAPAPATFAAWEAAEEEFAAFFVRYTHLAI